MDRTLLPNATQFPDILTDQVMPLVTGHEWKVIHYGVRYALGHRSSDTLSIEQIAHGRQSEDGRIIDRGTGLSESEVKECLAFLCDIVHLFLREDRPRKPHGYRLNLDLSSINWTALEQRHAGTPSVQSAAAEPPPQPAAATANLEPPALFVETPVTDVRLGSSDRPLYVLLREKLGVDEKKTFDYLFALAEAKIHIGQDDMVIWQLYHLWRTYGFRRLHNAFQSPLAAGSLDEISQSCLVGAVTEMLESERFGAITPSFREQIIELTREWPRLSDWQEAISLAVKLNKRRLQTVQTILRNKTATPAVAPFGDRSNGGTPVPAQRRKRPGRRQSEWTDEELRAGREADSNKEWTPPPE